MPPSWCWRWLRFSPLHPRYPKHGTYLLYAAWPCRNSGYTWRLWTLCLADESRVQKYADRAIYPTTTNISEHGRTCNANLINSSLKFQDKISQLNCFGSKHVIILRYFLTSFLPVYLSFGPILFSPASL